MCCNCLCFVNSSQPIIHLCMPFIINDFHYVWVCSCANELIFPALWSNIRQSKRAEERLFSQTILLECVEWMDARASYRPFFVYFVYLCWYVAHISLRQQRGTLQKRKKTGYLLLKVESLVFKSFFFVLFIIIIFIATIQFNIQFFLCFK